MYSCGPPHMDVQKQDDQHELTYSNYVRTQDVTLKTCQRQWMIGRSGERGSGISVLAARHDDDDENDQRVPFLTIQFVCTQFKWSNNSIWPIDRILSGATTPGERGTRSNGTKEILHIPQISKTEASWSDCLVLYLGHSLERRVWPPTAEMQSVYSIAPANWAK